MREEVLKGRSYSKLWGTELTSLVLVLLTLAGVFWLDACTPMIRTIDPAPSKNQMTLFDRYEVLVVAVLSHSPALEIRTHFVSDVPELAKYDTIPILMIDTVCFEGECLSGQVCRGMISWQEVNERFARSGREPRSWIPFGEPFRDNDLWAEYGVLVPSGFVMEMTPKLPSICDGTTIWLTFKARLLDRKTRKLIAQESKRVEFKVSKVRGGQ